MMKGDPREESNNTMFAKFHNHHHQQYYQFHHHLNQEHQIQLEEAEEDYESRTSSIGGVAGTQGTTPKRSKNETEEFNTAITSRGGDMATVEVVKRPRGRPPGSKNKPKPQVLFVSTPRDTTDYCSIMQPLILEVPGGVDVVESIARYACRRNVGVCILTASGRVSNISLHQSPTTLGGANVVTFHGSFDILSVSATFLPPSLTSSSPSLQSSLPTNYTAPFMITLAGPQGHIVGGSVVGTLVAATTVTLITASFNTPKYHRLPIEEDKVVPSSSVLSADGSDHHHSHNHPLHPQASVTASEESHPHP